MSLQIYTEKISMSLIYKLQKESSFFEYIGNKGSGLDDIYRQKRLPYRYINLSIIDDRLAGCVIFNLPFMLQFTEEP